MMSRWGSFLKHLIDAVRKGLKVSHTDGKQIGATATQVLVVNEEGLIAGLAENTLASLMAGQPIVSGVLICKRWEIR